MTTSSKVTTLERDKFDLTDYDFRVRSDEQDLDEKLTTESNTLIEHNFQQGQALAQLRLQGTFLKYIIYFFRKFTWFICPKKLTGARALKYLFFIYSVVAVLLLAFCTLRYVPGCVLNLWRNYGENQPGLYFYENSICRPPFENPAICKVRLLMIHFKVLMMWKRLNFISRLSKCVDKC